MSVVQCASDTAWSRALPMAPAHLPVAVIRACAESEQQGLAGHGGWRCNQPLKGQGPSLQLRGTPTPDGITGVGVGSSTWQQGPGRGVAKSVIYNGYFRCRAACAQWRALGGSLQGWAHRRTWPAPLRVTGRDGACIRLEWARVADDGVGMSFTAPRMHAWPCCRASFRHGFVEFQKRQNAPAAGKTGLIVQSNLG